MFVQESKKIKIEGKSNNCLVVKVVSSIQAIHPIECMWSFLLHWKKRRKIKKLRHLETKSKLRCYLQRHFVSLGLIVSLVFHCFGDVSGLSSSLWQLVLDHDHLRNVLRRSAARRDRFLSQNSLEMNLICICINFNKIKCFAKLSKQLY